MDVREGFNNRFEMKKRGIKREAIPYEWKKV